jgi:asparagine synthase (glutamine-hydrolysing)
MCGITGILLAPGADPDRLSAIGAMTATLRHRGPDDGGIWIDSAVGIALGHRRLSIVDLSEAGHQPMTSHSGGLVVTFNGEIYNFHEVRQELEDIGYCFRGHSDTEVMLAAFESFGVERALQRFNGMFALGLWDRRARVLHLIRDRLGEKPLYVASIGGALIFGSELKALLAVPGFRPKIDAGALTMILRHGWVADRHCIFKEVFKLPPGTILSLRAEELDPAGTVSLRERAQHWWSLAQVAQRGQQNSVGYSESELETELDRLLQVAVRERMLADVPVGAFLSGGIDSSSVVALMQTQSARPIRTFTIGFGEPGFNEAQHAAQVAQHVGTEHTEFHLTAEEACAVIPELPQVWDEPYAGESQIPTLLVSRLARQHVTVALSGDGGDECFGGYERHAAAPALAFMLGLPLLPRQVAAYALSVTRPELQERALRLLPLPRTWYRWLSEKKLMQVLGAANETDLYERITSPGLWPGSVKLTLSGEDSVPPLPDLAERLIYRDMADYLPGNSLVKVDRASMAMSLEARCPFLDHRVVEFAWSLPTAMKIRNGRGKWPLYRVLRRYLPQALFERPKHGFNVPIGTWLKGLLRDWAEELLAEPKIAQEGYLDNGFVQVCWHEHVSGRRDRGHELWAILMIEAWLEAMNVPTRGLISLPTISECAAARVEIASPLSEGHNPFGRVYGCEQV